MSINLSEKINNVEDFHVKLRYFNEMINEIQAVLALDPADVKVTQDAEREIATQMVRYRSAFDSVSQARTALEVSEQMLLRVETELQLCAKQAHDLAEATIRSVETKPQVRDIYKSGLRDIFSGARTGVTAQGDDDAPVPDQIEIGYEDRTTILRWQWQGAGAQTLRFEAAFAVGKISLHRGASTVTEGRQFLSIGTTEPGAEMRLPFLPDAVSKSNIEDGVPVTYRVRAVVSSGAVGQWSETVTVRHRDTATPAPEAKPTEPKRSMMSVFFEMRPKSAGVK